MMKKFKLVLAAIAVALLSTVAVADTIDFHTASSGGTWSYAGGASSYSGTAFNMTGGNVQLNGGPLVAINNLSVSVTTGIATSTSVSQVDFSNTGSSFIIKGDIGSGVVTLFTGSLNNSSVTILANGAGNTFTASFVVGTMSADAENFIYNISNGVDTTLVGDFTSTNTGQISDGSGTISGSSTNLNTVPEPASLALFGSGLLAGGNFVRRKYTKR